MTQSKDADIEALLLREKRARLPLPRQLLLYLDPFALFKDASSGPAPVRAGQLLLYLDPFALFKDASSGPAPVRARNLSYNRAMRWILVPYIRRWIMIAASLFLAIAPTEALAAQAKVFVIPAAALAVGACIALTVTFLIGAVYLLLGSRRD